MLIYKSEHPADLMLKIKMDKTPKQVTKDSDKKQSIKTRKNI